MHTETTDKHRMSRITSIEAREIKDGLDSMDGYLGRRHERSEVKLASETLIGCGSGRLGSRTCMNYWSALCKLPIMWRCRLELELELEIWSYRQDRGI